MYHFLRRIHLFTGLILLVFVLMYFVSGYIIIHADWFGGREPVTSTQTVPLDLPANITDAALVRHLESTFGIRGQASTPDHRKDGSIRVNFVRPRTAVQAVVKLEARQLTLTRREFGFAGVANGMHRLRGYKGGVLYWVWSLMYDLASLALIVFAITGIVLWHQSVRKRLAGWICLAASFGFTGAMILYLMMKK